MLISTCSNGAITLNFDALEEQLITLADKIANLISKQNVFSPLRS